MALNCREELAYIHLPIGADTEILPSMLQRQDPDDDLYEVISTACTALAEIVDSGHIVASIKLPLL